MKNKLFDLEEPGTKKETNKPASGERPKPIPLEKYIILCEKEEIIRFFSEYFPFAYAPHRINNGRDKGTYVVKIEINQIKADEPFQYENNKELFKKEVDSACKLWVFGTASAVFDPKTAIVYLSFSENYKKQIAGDYTENILPFYREIYAGKPAGTVKKPNSRNKKELFSLHE